MKAIVISKYGGPEVLQYMEVDKPSPTEDEVKEASGDPSSGLWGPDSLQDIEISSRGRLRPAEIAYLVTFSQ